jgi:O-antigen/teichoic acid export membrane protein
MFSLINRVWKKQGFVLVVAIMLVNALNLVFNAYLGRVLSFEAFGLITLLNTLWYIALISINALYTTLNHQVAFMQAKFGSRAADDFFRTVRKRVLAIASFAALLWLLFAPFISSFFHLPGIIIPIILTPLMILGVLTATQKGFLQGKQYFQLVSLIIIVEALCKLFLAVILVTIGLPGYAYLSVPLAVLISAALSYYLSSQRLSHFKKHTYGTFPRKFFFAAVLNTFSLTAFLTFDLILAKHYLLPEEYGQYALLSLIGKVIYFFGSAPNSLLLTKVSREKGLANESTGLFYKVFGISVLFTLASWFVIIISAKDLLPIVFGNKITSILPYLPFYTTAIALFTITTGIMTYHLVRHRFLFHYLAAFSTLLMAYGISIYHQTMQQIIVVLFITSIISFVIAVVLHVIEVHRNVPLPSLRKAGAYA